MVKIRQELGDTPVYLSFDIDDVDPSCCPGTGESVNLWSNYVIILSVSLQPWLIGFFLSCRYSGGGWSHSYSGHGDSEGLQRTQSDWCRCC